jgi:hypothetical protein
MLRSWTIRRLKARLRHAAKLHAEGALSNDDYAIIAVDVVERMRYDGKPVRLEHLENKSFSWIDFPVHAAIELDKGGPNWPPRDPKGAMKEFGPFNMATVWIHERLQGQAAFEPDPHGGFRWTTPASALLVDANRRYSRLGRAQYAIEAHLHTYSTVFPHLSSALGKVILALISGAIGFFLGRL